MINRYLAAALTAVALMGMTAAHADITLTMRAVMEGDMKADYEKMDAPTKARMDKMLGYQIYIQGDHSRTETFMITTIMDRKAGKSYTLNTAAKSYYEADIAKEGASPLPAQGNLTAGPTKLIDTKETSMLLGHKVRHYILTSHDAKTDIRLDEYIATDFPAHDMLPFKHGNQSVIGVPLKIQMLMSGSAFPTPVRVTTLAQSISAAPIDTRLFHLPAGYSQTDMASLFSGNSSLLAKGAAAPDFTVYTKDGLPVKLSDYRGKTVLLDFWSTWCGPCQQSLPNSQSLAARYKDQNLTVLCVNVWDTKKAFLDWLPEHTKFDALTFVIDTTEDRTKSIASALYKVSGIPTVYLIGKDGDILYAHTGYVDGDASTENAIKSALK